MENARDAIKMGAANGRPLDTDVYSGVYRSSNLVPP